MTPERLQELKPYTDFILAFINDLLKVFTVEGLSPEYQQMVRIFSMGLLLILVLALANITAKFIVGVIRPMLESLGRRSEYMLYVVFACLLLFFTSRVNFWAGCAALLVFIGVDIASKYYFKVWPLPAEEEAELPADNGDDEDEDDGADEDDARESKGVSSADKDKKPEK